MIHIITGCGKGKTSAAAGMAVRMSGAGGRVLFAQFLKGSPSGEASVLSKINGINVMRLSKNYGFSKNMTADDKSAVKKEHGKMLFEAVSGKYDMVILDEIFPALSLGLADGQLFENALGGGYELVLTGRGAPDYLFERADYVSEIKKIKHPFDRGITARRGIEY
ncbi:MAG TPA: cob(I)yrinic acid a,c-diamide adenosyltransferase [Candidatus Ornithomonoglobus intestinigallinarum]|uniref:Cob(I)yrinic acid a,c-diamide adenosyltransferase n=1 Tax=Candidatus Ornithomonoglobus intestinigallinarum TaxID=2840894 RepID=A0A9D1H541_9FIRM|nr:cob(I)yrinic acid a,c-diamide adenosyltransferase [Candidatus Ornithomonoglobus intestinigallinarum]